MFASPAAQVVGCAAVGKAVREIAAVHQHVRDLVAHHRRAEREIAAGQAFRQHHEIRLELPQFAREPLAEAPEAGDHFIRDEENVVLARQIAQTLDIPDRAAR